MAKGNVKIIIEAMSADPKAQELLANAAQPADQDGEIRVFAEIAGQLGYDITEADIKTYLDKTAELMAERTEEAAAEIEELSDEVLDKVAGGKKEHDDCKDTYRNFENCWITDGCDNIFNLYDHYICHKLNWKDPCHETARPCDNDMYCDHGFTHV